ncbi:glutamate-rich WD repeat-containing protein 1 isoform X2 [Hydra vulgaris]|uniref:Glutamate-rich WD repeat-containing protein 1 n=1 Tax=Hydra vulgaris TaxID=6087 RepID=A0ABM4D561_HYDVU
MDEISFNNDNEMSTQDNDDGKEQVNEKIYLGEPLEDGEELTFDKTAYHMYHAAQTGMPCLSFDVINDKFGENRTQFPMTCYLVSGTQACEGEANQILLMKMSNLTKITEDDDSEDSYIEESDEQPNLQTYSIKHIGGVNRIRYIFAAERHLTASWSSSATVHIWDLTEELNSLDINGLSQHQSIANKKPLFSFSGHQKEGFAMDWSPTVAGRLATGSCNNRIHLWSPTESSWHVDQRPLTSHTASVEDIQWSPNESNVFSSCSADKTIKIWDSRGVGDKACMLTVKAHDADVNVISWNKNDPFIVSGGDDGIINVWDLRRFQQGMPVATFKHHSAPITSVEWHHSDSTVFAASSDDDQITLWDLSVERDEEHEAENVTLPPQLLFIHMGQKDIKELHWHRQLPGVLASTALSGFNIFKTISV